MNPLDLGELHFRRALAAIESGNWKQASSELRQAIDLNPAHAPALQELGWLTYGKVGTPEESRKLLEAALRIDSSLGDAEMYLGIVLGHLGMTRDAEDHFRRSIVLLTDSALASATYATFLAEQGRFGEAELEFRNALDRDPALLPGLRDYARLLAILRREDEAESLFKRAFEIDPDDKWTHHRYGAFLSRLPGREAQAEQLLRRAVEKDPAYRQAREDLEALLNAARKSMPK